VTLKFKKKKNTAALLTQNRLYNPIEPALIQSYSNKKYFIKKKRTKIH